MNKGLTKKESLERLDGEFLRELALNLNGDYFGSYREYSGYSKEKMEELISNKLTVDEVETVVSGYLLCHDVADIANSITPDGTQDIKKAVEEHFGKDGIHEVKIGSRFCDLVFPEELVAVEVKSARDKVGRAIDQAHDYSQWADEVFLAYDVANKDLIPKELRENGVGLLSYDELSVEVEKPARPTSSSKEDLLNSMTYDHLGDLAKEHGVSATGKKQDITGRLSSKLSKFEVRSEFSEYLQLRGLSEIGH